MSERFVKVAVPVPLHRLFSYRVPEGSEVVPGMRVRVSFGPRPLVGVVVEGPSENPPEGISPGKVKALSTILDETPSLDRSLLDLCAWMAAYYHLAPGEAYLLPLPPGLLGAKAKQGRSAVLKREKKATWLRAADEGERLGAKMLAALDWLEGRGPQTFGAVQRATGASSDTLARLHGRGFVSLSEHEARRDHMAALEVEGGAPPTPTPEQASVIAEVELSFGAFQGFLLMGVTGSGKTEVYMQLIERVLDRGSGALVLVPEIALTPQLVGHFRARLGDQIAVLHSGLSPAARAEQWVRIRRGELPVVIGARSALFAPLPKLGLVVVDEEHEGSFKQDTSPRYQARDLALVRARQAACPVLLGTATPSAESWANVQRDKLKLLRLTQRVHDRPMPEVKVIDLREEPTVDPDRVISGPLLKAMQDNLEAKQQTILFVNRRGFASFVVCRSCGEAMSCDACSVTYTWHRRRARLVCHWCDQSTHWPSTCPACKADALQEIGFGTERVESAVSALLPNARIARMDRDTTRGKALPRLLEAMRAREIDILIGTQMVAKGHDFPGVTLVGVLMAELGLRIPDFRASERTFQLMTQIAGRAGRAETPGRMLLQTLVPDHYAIQHAIKHDAVSFLSEENTLRKALRFPPFGSLALFRLSGADIDRVQHEAGRIAASLRHMAPKGLSVQGPMPAPIERVRGKWRFQVMARAQSRHLLGVTLKRLLEAMEADKVPSGLQISLDVDPYTFL